MIVNSTKYPTSVQAGEDGNGGWYLAVDGIIQRPTFQSLGAALIFGDAVHEGTRPAEPFDLSQGRYP